MGNVSATKTLNHEPKEVHIGPAFARRIERILNDDNKSPITYGKAAVGVQTGSTYIDVAENPKIEMENGKIRIELADGRMLRLSPHQILKFDRATEVAVFGHQDFDSARYKRFARVIDRKINPPTPEEVREKIADDFRQFALGALLVFWGF
ncbi:hypothetical protein K1X76_07620 [bacterium]|nr:hypothetical protein [bacterium]